MRKRAALSFTSLIFGLFLAVFLWCIFPSEKQILVPTILADKTEQFQSSLGNTITAQSTSLSTGSKVSAANTSSPSCNAPEHTVQPLVPQSKESGLHIGDIQIGYYQVYGTQASQIVGQIYHCTPITTDVGRYSASTNYSLNWSATYTVLEDDICIVTSPRVNIGIAQTFPEWTVQSTSSPDTIAKWQKYIANLKAHENEHADIDKNYAQQLFDMLNSAPQGECTALQNDTNQKAQQIITNLDKANDDYDLRTKHGTTEGAML